MKKFISKHKNNIVAGFGVFVAVSLIFVASMSAGNSGLLSGSEFISKYHDTPDAILVDVRTPDEYNAGHIAGAIDIDFESSSFMSEVQKLDTSKTYFIYCRSGNRSGQASVLMKQNGIKNLYELRGGISTNPALLNS